MVARKVSGFCSDHTEIYAFTVLGDNIIHCQVQIIGNFSHSPPAILPVTVFCLLLLSSLPLRSWILAPNSCLKSGFLKKKCTLHVLLALTDFDLFFVAFTLSDTIILWSHHIQSDLLWSLIPLLSSLTMEPTGAVLALSYSDGTEWTHVLLFSLTKSGIMVH